MILLWPQNWSNNYTESNVAILIITFAKSQTFNKGSQLLKFLLPKKFNEWNLVKAGGKRDGSNT